MEACEDVLNLSAGAIRDVLFRVWDPLNVNEIEELSDEYDSFIAPIAKLLSTGALIGAIAEALVAFESELGVPTSREKRRDVAELLVNLRRGHAQ